MTILILGNGFDINLGLPTSYNQFLKSDEFQSYCNLSLFEYLSKKNNIQNWIDVEVELKNYSFLLIENSKIDYGGNYNQTEELALLSKKFNKEYRLLKTQLHSYLERVIQKSLFNSMSLNLSNKLIWDLAKQSEDLKIVSFNYTGTAKTLFKDASNVEIFEVHNCLGQEIVFGTEDINDVINNQFSFILKSTAGNFGQIFNFKSNFQRADKIVFYGYSFGETDFNYYKSYFESIANSTVQSKVKIVIYYYDEDGSDLNGQDAKDSINQNLRKLLGSRLADFKINCTFSLLPTSSIKKAFLLNTCLT
jgi:hypothetical protein